MQRIKFYAVDSGILESDFLVVGSGLAGLYSALNAARYGTVTLVTKEGISASSSYWAQGGVAAVIDSADSYEYHIADTLEAGRDYCNRDAVEILITEGAACINTLIDEGMPFDKTASGFDLGLEGGHSKRRIFHANGAATGKALIDFLLPKITSNRNIQVLEHTFIHNLISRSQRCFGADGYSYKKNKIFRIFAKATILATGGYSGLFSRTTNPHTSTGDGLWLALNHGATLKDMEFVQFHPTAFYSESGESFLISEALRGEGAKLMNERGNYFMDKYPQKDLSPRDMVSKEIFRQIEYQNKPYVYLDLTMLNYRKLKVAFPDIIRRVESQGINIKKEGVPVSPAAHYCIGGIETDIHGYTGIDGLYACGEVAATGVHGANRLASNSLLECLVFGKRAVYHASSVLDKAGIPDVAKSGLEIDPRISSTFQSVKKEVSYLLNRYAGIERNKNGLMTAEKHLKKIRNGIPIDERSEYYSIRLYGMLDVAEAIINGAMQRKESRGVHFRLDFPEADKKLNYPFKMKSP